LFAEECEEGNKIRSLTAVWEIHNLFIK